MANNRVLLGVIMSNERKVNFSTTVRNGSIYDDVVIKLLIGFVPTEEVS